jgi:hypothetical protein
MQMTVQILIYSCLPLDTQWGKHYYWLFENRQKTDYHPLTHFDVDQVREIIEKSVAFVQEMQRLVQP